MTASHCGYPGSEGENTRQEFQHQQHFASQPFLRATAISNEYRSIKAEIQPSRKLCVLSSSKPKAQLFANGCDVPELRGLMEFIAQLSPCATESQQGDGSIALLH